MTMEVFRDWLENLDKIMRQQKRNILLILDNAAGHNTTSDFQLTNVKLGCS